MSLITVVLCSTGNDWDDLETVCETLKRQKKQIRLAKKKKKIYSQMMNQRSENNRHEDGKDATYQVVLLLVVINL